MKHKKRSGRGSDGKAQPSQSRSYEQTIDSPVAVAQVEYCGLQATYEHFNVQLFGGRLARTPPRRKQRASQSRASRGAMGADSEVLRAICRDAGGNCSGLIVLDRLAHGRADPRDLEGGAEVANPTYYSLVAAVGPVDDTAYDVTTIFSAPCGSRNAPDQYRRKPIRRDRCGSSIGSKMLQLLKENRSTHCSGCRPDDHASPAFGLREACDSLSRGEPGAHRASGGGC